MSYGTQYLLILEIWRVALHRMGCPAFFCVRCLQSDHQSYQCKKPYAALWGGQD